VHGKKKKDHETIGLEEAYWRGGHKFGAKQNATRVVSESDDSRREKRGVSWAGRGRNARQGRDR